MLRRSLVPSQIAILPSPLPPRAKRVAGRGRGRGVSPLAPLAATLLRHPPPPTPPRRFAEGGEKKIARPRRGAAARIRARQLRHRRDHSDARSGTGKAARLHHRGGRRRRDGAAAAQQDGGARRRRHRRCAGSADPRRPPRVQGRRRPGQDLDAAPPAAPGEIRRRRALRHQVGIRAQGRPADRDCRTGRRHPAQRPHAGAARRHRLGQDLHHGQGDRGHSKTRHHPGAEQDARRAALWRVQEFLSRQRGGVFRQLITTITSPKLTSRGPTPTSKKTRRSTSRSTACAIRRRGRCWSATTSSSSPPCRASTVSVRSRPIPR